MSLSESMSRLGGSNATNSNSLSNPLTLGELVHKTPRARKRVLKDMRRLAKFMKNSKFTRWAPDSLIKLKKFMPKPAGCAFLESCATTTNVWLGEYRKNPQALMVDSGSDITLISQNALKSMDIPPESKTGQKVNLIQVNGTSKISGYVTVPIFFNSDSGPLQLEVEAYVVKDMATPIILGNDFADQYSISLIQEGPDSYLLFGNTGWKTKTDKLVGAPLVTKASHSLSIGASDTLTHIPKFKKTHRGYLWDSSVRTPPPATPFPESCISQARLNQSSAQLHAKPCTLSAILATGSFIKVISWEAYP
jgi:gag-polyprotein putative aspartyl protease